MPGTHPHTIKKRGQYTEVQLQGALDALKNGKSLSEASAAYCIPRRIIRRKN